MKIKIVIIIFIVLVAAGGIFYMTKVKKVQYQDTQMDVVLSLEDQVTTDSIWCGTFNLIWNDLKNNLAKQDIVFTPQLEAVTNLNKGTFTTKDISAESFYKVYGNPSLKLKGEIEKAIKEKFNETSDILDDFNWEGASPKDYFLYAMLKKVFEFPKEFTDLGKSNFASYNNIEFFGINDTTKSEVREQVKVLYYNSEDDFAIKLVTKGNDEVIISKGNNASTFKDIYNEIMNQELNYQDNKNFGQKDTLKIPNISFKIKKEFTDLENKEFYFSNGDTYVIDMALQTIEFDLDKKGGRIKSEAGIGLKYTSVEPKEEIIRHFNVDNTFAILLKEKDKNLPYFATKISNIKNVQAIAE